MGKINKRQVTSATHRLELDSINQYSPIETEHSKEGNYDKHKECDFLNLGPISHDFHKAVKNGHTKKVEKLLEDTECASRSELKTFLLSRDKLGKTALHYAIETENANIVNKLLTIAAGIKDNHYTLKELLLNPDRYGDTAINCAITVGSIHLTNKLLITARYIGKDTLNKLYSGCTKYIQEQRGVINTPFLFDQDNIHQCIEYLQSSTYDEKCTLQELLFSSSPCTEYTNSTLSTNSTHKELENLIDQDSNDSPANMENENVNTESSGWFQLLKWPRLTIFNRVETTMIKDKIAYSEAHTSIQTNYILANVPKIPNHLSDIMLISNDTNNTVQNSVQGVESSINSFIMLFIYIMSMFGLNISFGNNDNNDNNGTSLTQEHEIKLSEIKLNLPKALIVKENYLRSNPIEDDPTEGNLTDLLLASINISSSQLQGNIQEDETE